MVIGDRRRDPGARQRRSYFARKCAAPNPGAISLWLCLATLSFFGTSRRSWITNVLSVAVMLARKLER